MTPGSASTVAENPAAGKPVGSKIDLSAAHMVGIGGLKVVLAPGKMRTVLGSCVGIAIFDVKAGVAGLAHSILPVSNEESIELGKFADQAVDNLVIKLASEGAVKHNMRAKLVGGAAMFGSDAKSRLGERNVESANNRLQAHNIPVVAEAVGGTKGRKMLLDSASGEIVVEIIGENPETI